MENLMLAPKLRAKAAKKAGDAAESVSQIRERAEELLRVVGLSEKADAYPCQLSGGQQQRVAIARALMLAPDILCFDEPTSSLDPELTGEVLRVIRSLKDSERTMIIVTHEMEFARNVADRIIFMADGVIEEMGTPEEVFNHPKSDKTRAFLAAGDL
jgi:polar amino acid transport system ATP-binding protein